MSSRNGVRRPKGPKATYVRDLFILRKKKSLVAIEVKSNAEKNTAGLDKFTQMFNPESSLIVGDGGIGVEEFLSMDINKLF